MKLYFAVFLTLAPLTVLAYPKLQIRRPVACDFKLANGNWVFAGAASYVTNAMMEEGAPPVRLENGFASPSRYCVMGERVAEETIKVTGWVWSPTNYSQDIPTDTGCAGTSEKFKPIITESKLTTGAWTSITYKVDKIGQIRSIIYVPRLDQHPDKVSNICDELLTNFRKSPDKISGSLNP